MWLHRVDICDATGRPFELSAAHNAFMLALVVEDTARFLRKRLPSANVVLELTGEGAGVWQLARGASSRVTLSLAVADFVRRTGARVSVEETARRTSSNAGAAEVSAILELLQAPY